MGVVVGESPVILCIMETVRMHSACMCTLYTILVWQSFNDAQYGFIFRVGGGGGAFTHILHPPEIDLPLLRIGFP